MWVDQDGTAGWKRPSGKGGRLIVLHAGSVNGWVAGAELDFHAKSSSGDYNNEMNIQHLWSGGKHNFCPTHHQIPLSYSTTPATIMVLLKRCQRKVHTSLKCKLV